MLVERLLRGRTVAAVMVDEQVAGDRDQPGADAGALGVVSVPRAQRALERLLGQVLGVGAAAEPIGEEAVDGPDLVVVGAGEALGVARHHAGACSWRKLSAYWVAPDTYPLPPFRRDGETGEASEIPGPAAAPAGWAACADLAGGSDTGTRRTPSRARTAWAYWYGRLRSR